MGGTGIHSHLTQHATSTGTRVCGRMFTDCGDVTGYAFPIHAMKHSKYMYIHICTKLYTTMTTPVYLKYMYLWTCSEWIVESGLENILRVNRKQIVRTRQRLALQKNVRVCDSSSVTCSYQLEASQHRLHADVGSDAVSSQHES